MPLANKNPLPFKCGGSPTRFEKAYAVIRRMVGRNGYADDDDEIEAQWRQAKAYALANIASQDERAARQISPDYATDHIPLFEEMLGIPSDDTLSDEQRRQRIVPDYVSVPEAWTESLVAQLKAIDPLAEIITRPWATAATTQIGRWYEEFTPIAGKEYDDVGARKATAYPSFSDMHEVLVQYDLGNAVAPNREQDRKTLLMQELLNDTIPAWVSFRIIYTTTFSLDSSLLDFTGFGT